MTIDYDREFRPLNIAVLTVSDTRTTADDTSGDILTQRATLAGHKVVQRAIVTDDTAVLASQISDWVSDAGVEVVIATGGTGLTGRDVTPEALSKVRADLGGRDIPGFGELFRWLSLKTIGTSTIQSRACAIVAGGTYVFALPGSNGAVKDGWDGILVEQLDSRNRPCNFADLIPRLQER